jgi:diadenylate cyclase
METFFNNILSSISIMDVLDIFLVAIIVYRVLGFIKETRAEQLAKGIVLLLVATLLSSILNLYTLHWLLSGVMTVGLVALVVIFQPELRRALEHIGRSRFVSILGDIDKEEAKKMVGEIVKSVEQMSLSRTGALIVIEKEITLNDIVETGTIIDAVISSELIGNIFYEGAPLHDGALILRGDRLYAAGCVLPLTQNKQLNKELGTRHRAGIGITENSDALVIIVSEETGIISIAQNGGLIRFVDSKKVEKMLLDLYLQDEKKENFQDKIKKVFKGGKNVE